MIRVRSLREGGIQLGEGVAALREAVANDQPDWISVTEPDAAEVEALCEVLGLHELAVRDALAVGSPPKIADFGAHLFFIVHTPVAKAFDQTRKIAVFLAPHWIATVQRTRSDAMDEIARRVELDPGYLLATPSALAHVVIDHMTGGFEDLTAGILDEIAQLEEAVLAGPDGGNMQALLALRRRVMGLLRVTRSQRDVCASLCRATHPAIPHEVLPYLRDVYDHVLRLHDMLEVARDSLAITRDAYLTVVNNRLSEVMRTLTVIATIMLPLSLLAGVYGMNFGWMPLLDHPLGFWFALGGMGLIAAGMLWWFRRRHWV